MNELDPEMVFFIYLLENYAADKKTGADLVLAQWDAAGLTDFFYRMYERYHSEALENAFEDIDRMMAQAKSGAAR